MTFLHKLIISNKHLRGTSFWWWIRLMSHRDFRFDDYNIWTSFWFSLNKGYLDMEYKWEFEQYWGKNAKPEIIYLSEENYDRLVERLNEPPDPVSIERLKKIMQKPTLWDEK